MLDKRRSNTVASLLSFLFIMVSIFVAVTQIPAATDYRDDDPSTFSQDRVLKHLAHIAAKPHPIGSDAHTQVRMYLVAELKKMGLEVEVSEQLVTHDRVYRAMPIKNIIAKISGLNSQKALAVVSHYDSAENSFGASDAGSGVATILEGIRAFLAQGKKPNNDIIILFTDAEEQGLMGANAFVSSHPWARNIAVVLNFEARGSGGQSLMLIETNHGNAKLIKHFSDAGVNYPVANSLMYEVYKKLPNSTDLTEFRTKGDIDGFNFAFIDDHFDYHTLQDSVERLDLNTLNHQADYLTALLDYFAFSDLEDLRSEFDSVYFNVPIIGMIVYSDVWNWPLIILTLLSLAWLTYRGIKQQKLGTKGLMIGFVPLLGAIGLSLTIGLGGWHLLVSLFPEFRDIPQGFTYNGHMIMVGGIVLSISAGMWCYHLFLRHYRVAELVWAPMVLWAVINMAISLMLPGGSFLIVTLLCAVACFYGALRFNEAPNKIIIISAILALPTLFIAVPFIPLLIIALGLKMLVVGTVFSVVILCLLMSVWGHYQRLMWLVVIGGGLSVFLLSSALYDAGYNEQQRKPNSINYVYDKQRSQAAFFSYDKHLDDFTQQFIKQPSNESWGDDLYPDSFWRPVTFHQSAPLFSDITPAAIQIINEKILNGDRVVEFEITPHQQSEILELITADFITIKQLKIDSHLFSQADEPLSRYVNGRFFRYKFNGERSSIRIELTIEGVDNVLLKLAEISLNSLYQFPQYQLRGKQYMPHPFAMTDAIILTQSIPLIQGLTDENN